MSAAPEVEVHPDEQALAAAIAGPGAATPIRRSDFDMGKT
jgi:hypothetical protein